MTTSAFDGVERKPLAISSYFFYRSLRPVAQSEEVRVAAVGCAFGFGLAEGIFVSLTGRTGGGGPCD
jgi:hypothetical protein